MAKRMRVTIHGSRRPRSSGDTLGVQTVPTADATNAEHAIQLLDDWMADESGYDEATWPILRAALDEDRPSERKLFGE
jgi:hypothetical protein